MNECRLIPRHQHSFKYFGNLAHRFLSANQIFFPFSFQTATLLGTVDIAIFAKTAVDPRTKKDKRRKLYFLPKTVFKSLLFLIFSAVLLYVLTIPYLIKKQKLDTQINHSLLGRANRVFI